MKYITNQLQSLANRRTNFHRPCLALAMALALALAWLPFPAAQLRFQLQLQLQLLAVAVAGCLAQHYYHHHHRAHKVSAAGCDGGVRCGGGGGSEGGCFKSANETNQDLHVHSYCCSHMCVRAPVSVSVCVGECVCSISFGLFSGNNISWH